MTKLLIIFILCLSAPLLFAQGSSNQIDLSFFDESKTAPTQNQDKISNSLDIIYTTGSKAYITGNYITAFKVFKGLAEKGYSDAQFSLAAMYHNGEGTTLKSNSKAAHWYRLSAQQGHQVAQYNLGALYYYGTGVTKDYSLAFKWFNQAAQHGYTAAQYNLATMYLSAKGVSQNYRLAFKWFQSAASQGNANSQHHLAAMYQIGLGVNKNLAMAFHWHTKAAQNGQKQSITWIQTQFAYRRLKLQSVN